MASAISTRDHEEIRRWAEERGGVPTIVKGTGGLLRIDFTEGPQSGGREPSLEEVSWDEWFRIFDESQLTFLCSPEEDSKFFKLVAEEKAGEKTAEKTGTRGRGRRRAARSAEPRPTQARAGAEVPPVVEKEVSGAKKRMASPKSALPLLREQHRFVERLFQYFNRTKAKEEQRACFEVLADQLAAHTEIEERFFYPAVKLKQTEELLQHSIEEHLEAKQLISELLKKELDADAQEFSSKVKELEKVVRDHVQEEESKIFPGVQALFTSEELDEIGANMQELYVRLIEMEPRLEVPAHASQPASLD
jgi:hemerythrin superfamily protein